MAALEFPADQLGDFVTCRILQIDQWRTCLDGLLCFFSRNRHTLWPCAFRFPAILGYGANPFFGFDSTNGGWTERVQDILREVGPRDVEREPLYGPVVT